MSRGRYYPSSSYGHKYKLIAMDCYQISWIVDRYYSGSRLRFPTVYRRITDRLGVMRFCKKWNLVPPNSACTKTSLSSELEASQNQQSNGAHDGAENNPAGL